MKQEDIAEQLRKISTATLATLLFKKGLRSISPRGITPLQPGTPRIAGPVFTMRFLPIREDLATPDAWSSPTSSRVATDTVPKGYIAVVETQGRIDAGALGDILCARLKVRGCVGLLTDGAVRDREGIKKAGLPVWSAGVAPSPAVADMFFDGWGMPIACGGVTLFEDDWVVADEDGAVVLPAAMVTYLLENSIAMEQEEDWILDQVMRGRALDGLYPMSEGTRQEYEKEIKKT